MRVCTPGGTDSYGNTCTWTGCGHATTQNQYFGGCTSNPTAGTLCCAQRAVPGSAVTGVGRRGLSSFECRSVAVGESARFYAKTFS
jgi:hypothetical protein